MKKMFSSVAVMLLLAMTLSLLTAVPLQAAGSKTSEDPNQDFWTEYLQEEGYAPYTEGFNPGAFRYAVMDLNNDGRAELLLHSYEKNAPRSHTWIFTRNSKGRAVKVLEAITLSDVIYYSNYLDAFCIWRPMEQKHEFSFATQTGSVCEEFIRLNGTRISTVATYRHPQDCTVAPQPAGIFSKDGVNTELYPWDEKIIEIKSGTFVDWKFLMPEEGTVVQNAQELSSYIGSDATAFRKKFHCNDLAGTGNLYYTNHIITLAGLYDTNKIYGLTLDQPGCPYSLMGLQVGMTAEEAMKILKRADARQMDSSSGFSFAFPDDLVLSFYTEDFQGTERILALSLFDSSISLY